MPIQMVCSYMLLKTKTVGKNEHESKSHFFSILPNNYSLHI